MFRPSENDKGGFPERTTYTSSTIAGGQEILLSKNSGSAIGAVVYTPELGVAVQGCIPWEGVENL